MKRFQSRGDLVDVLTFVRTMFSSLSNNPDAWEWAIARFETQDRLHPPQKNGIVFTGSSSITFWDSLEADMAPLPVLNRGFGGSRMNDVVRYAHRIVTPYQPRVVVLFAGTNDIAPPKPKTADDVFEGYKAFVQAVHADLPAVPIYYISITPSPLRWKLWPVAAQANQLIKEFSEGDGCLHYIDIAGQFLTAEGLPDPSLYRIDKLHPNKVGYIRWTAGIKPTLMAALEV
jgi:lysophospholipase L1-like esterase